MCVPSVWWIECRVSLHFGSKRFSQLEHDRLPEVMKRKAGGKWAEEWLWSLIFYLIYELFTSPSFSRASLAWYALIGQNASTTDWARLYMVHARRRPGIEMTDWQRHLHLPSSHLPPPPPQVLLDCEKLSGLLLSVCVCVCVCATVFVCPCACACEDVTDE